MQSGSKSVDGSSPSPRHTTIPRRVRSAALDGNPLTRPHFCNEPNTSLQSDAELWHQPPPPTSSRFPFDSLTRHAMTLHQGDCIQLTSDDHTYQVIGVDDRHDRCWVRRWPLARHGSPDFEISLQQVAATGHSRPPRKLQGA